MYSSLRIFIIGLLSLWSLQLTAVTFDSFSLYKDEQGNLMFSEHPSAVSIADAAVDYFILDNQGNLSLAPQNHVDDTAVEDAPDNNRDEDEIVVITPPDDTTSPVDLCFDETRFSNTNHVHYALHAKHPSGAIGSSSNTINLTVFSLDNGYTLIKECVIGSFTNQTDHYEMYYSSDNKPLNGHDKTAIYHNTPYAKLSESYMYASNSKQALYQAIKNNQNTCLKRAANYAGGNLNRNDNFWVYFCPKSNLLNYVDKAIVENTDTGNVPTQTENESVSYCGLGQWIKHPKLTGKGYCENYGNNITSSLLEEVNSKTTCGGYYKTYGYYEADQRVGVKISNGNCEADQEIFRTSPPESLTAHCKKYGGTGNYRWMYHKEIQPFGGHGTLGVTCEMNLDIVNQPIEQEDKENIEKPSETTRIVPIFKDNFADFSNSNDPSWVSFGSPLPRKLSQIAGAEDGFVWDTNGDGSHHSGSYLKTIPLRWDDEFTVEFRLKQPLAEVEHWLYTDLSIVENPDNNAENRRSLAHIRISGGLSHNYATNKNAVRASIVGDDDSIREEVNFNDGQWHTYKIHHKMIDQNTRHFKISIDDVVFFEKSDSDFNKNDLYVNMEGRSYQSDNYLDYVTVFKRVEKPEIKEDNESEKNSETEFVDENVCSRLQTVSFNPQERIKEISAMVQVNSGIYMVMTLQAGHKEVAYLNLDTKQVEWSDDLLNLFEGLNHDSIQGVMLAPENITETDVMTLPIKSKTSTQAFMPDYIQLTGLKPFDVIFLSDIADGSVQFLSLYRTLTNFSRLHATWNANKTLLTVEDKIGQQDYILDSDVAYIQGITMNTFNIQEQAYWLNIIGLTDTLNRPVFEYNIIDHSSNNASNTTMLELQSWFDADRITAVTLAPKQIDHIFVATQTDSQPYFHCVDLSDGVKTTAININKQVANNNDIAEQDNQSNDVNEEKPDTTPPVITLLGDNSVTIEQHSVYEDAGATAIDDIDGSVRVDVVNSVDISQSGTYLVTYTATDKAGNTVTAERTVNVKNRSTISTAPINNVSGNNANCVDISPIATGRIIKSKETGEFYNGDGYASETKMHYIAISATETTVDITTTSSTSIANTRETTSYSIIDWFY